MTTWTLGVFPSLQERSLFGALASSFIHWGMIGWICAFLLVTMSTLLVRRARLLAVVVPLAVGLLWQATWLLPYYRTNPVPHAEPMTVATINVFDGQASLGDLIEETTESDVIVVVEISAVMRAELAASGWSQTHPYQLHVGSGIPGTSLYSRFPIDDLGRGPTMFGSLLARVHHTSGAILVAGVHPINNVRSKGRWLHEANALQDWLGPYQQDGLVIAGDFNAIDRHVTMRPWFDQGFASAAAVSGAGLPRTWPAGGWAQGSPAPFPLIGIDHVLVGPGMTATAHDTFALPGTDHFGLRVGVARKSE